MARLAPRDIRDILLAAIAVGAIGLALASLGTAARGVAVAPMQVGQTPATVYTPASGAFGPVLVIAHGFAGSQQLMQSFALAAAQNGYAAVTFDFAGHGRNPVPLGGSITEVDGATRRLVEELAAVAQQARGLGDGRLGVLGHSMASDIVVRFAQETPGVGATIAVSMFAPTVTATSPANLLVLVGEFESSLQREALRAIGLGIAPAGARPGVTYGNPAQGNARRMVAIPGTEHVGVLFSRDSLRETVLWLDQAFGIEREGAPALAPRGPAILLLLGGVVLLAWPLSRAVPRVVPAPVGSGLGWRRLWPVVLVPMIAVPLVLSVLPTHFLPVLVGDYLAAHFLGYGAATVACLVALRGRRPPQAPARVSGGALAAAAGGAVAFGFIALVWPIDRFLTAFVPGTGRLTLFLAMLVGTTAHFLASEWATRGTGAARAGYAAVQAALLVSLGLAVALDFERLFFLVIILPVIVVFFVIYGIFSALLYRRSRHPAVAAIASAVAFAWAISVTFPLLEG